MYILSVHSVFLRLCRCTSTQQLRLVDVVVRDISESFLSSFDKLLVIFLDS